MLFQSHFIQDFVNKFLVFYETIFRLALLQHLLNLFFTHRHTVRSQIVSHLACWQHSTLLLIKYSETLHQLFFHCHLSFFVYLFRMFHTTKLKKSAKSIWADCRGLSIFCALSPRLQMTGCGDKYLHFRSWLLRVSS